ncbi:DUF4181 domain-containing protein [Lysinibacillus odysseyi]|uniref:DUF4181 domain-containing protein n=1 Tax=Lysinibacillus odysseyi 34hs-1 = NBRC 100172 TaxID=1220589 RepID=A0A0A3IAF3_9BACI|nr:DUF4181 domain-containing protein [Lysinibacillus odysseyi]KGR81714.1 hypothetical protein CD32_20430 [Lysinibacillus odysseyi 34hs-1 = NBRC 100172]
MFITILIGAVIAAGIFDLYLRKKYKIEKNEKFTDQFVNKKHMIFEIIACVFFLAFLSASGATGKQLYFLVFLFFAMLYAIRTLLERLLYKEKKKYIVSLVYVMICLVCSFGILLFL